MVPFRAFPVVLAAPSGAGKTSLARAVVERSSDIVFALSATTRAPRPGERHGEDYHFVDDAGFDRMIEAGELLEWATVHGRRYGTMRRGVEGAAAEGRTVLLDIDVQGARQLRTVLPDAVLLFILPPSVAEMSRRLVTRGSGEDSSELATRMRTARAEIDWADGFDYIIVNDEFEQSVRLIESVIAAERCSVARLAGLDGALADLRRDIDELTRRSS
jgi:guanylate kinase